MSAGVGATDDDVVRSRSAVSVIVAVFDNEDTLRELAARTFDALAPVAGAVDLWFVDDASTDGSWDVIRALASEDPRIHGIALASRSGNLTARAVASTEVEGPVVCSLDADLENAPEDLPALVTAVQRGAELVSAVRIDQSGRPASIRLMSRGLRHLVGRSFAFRPRDFGCGMKAWHVDLARRAATATDEELHLNWAVTMHRLARSYDEVDVVWRDMGRRSSHGPVLRVRMALELARTLRGRPTPGHPRPAVRGRC